MTNIFENLRDYCKSGFVSRQEIGRLTGGLLNAGTMAQLDHKKLGIMNRKRIGNKTIYSIDDVITWLSVNTELINFND